MIRKAHEMRLNDEVELKGGKGTIKIVNILEQDEVYGTGRLFAISIIPPGCSIGYHQHVGDFETYYLLKGGKGTIKIVNILEQDEVYGTGRLFAISIIPPGCSIGYHQHVGDFETYYFLKGKAKVVDNGKEDILGPGDSMVCYEGDWHGIENIGDEDLEYVAVILYTEQKKEAK